MSDKLNKPDKPNDPFDPANLRVPPDKVQAHQEQQAAKQGGKSKGKRTQLGFTMFFDDWTIQLAAIRADGPAYRVALFLQRTAKKDHTTRVKLANGELEERGVTRWQKYRALEQLSKAGLVSIERRGRKSPIVTLRFVDVD